MKFHQGKRLGFLAISFPHALLCNLSHIYMVLEQSLEGKSPRPNLPQKSASIQGVINGHSRLVIMMNGNFTLVTAKTKTSIEIPPKSAANGIYRKRMPIGSPDWLLSDCWTCLRFVNVSISKKSLKMESNT